MSPQVKVIKEKSKKFIDKFDGIDNIVAGKKSNVIILTDEEMELAQTKGRIIHKESEKNFSKLPKKVKNDIIGIQGELICCKFCGREWKDTINTYKKADIGTKTQVRTTNGPNNSLIFRPDDLCNLDEAHLLVTMDDNEGTVRGWLYGYECIKDDTKIWTNKGMSFLPMAWFVPQSLLRTPESFDIDTVEQGFEFKKLFGGINIYTTSVDIWYKFGLNDMRDSGNKLCFPHIIDLWNKKFDYNTELLENAFGKDYLEKKFKKKYERIKKDNIEKETN